MEWAEVSARRRMVRRYDAERPVDDAVVDAVVGAAVRAPSAGFTQAVSYLVLTGSETAGFWALTAAADAPADRWLRGLRTAPVLILVWTDQEAYLDRYAEPDKGWTDRDPQRWSAPYWWVDAGMAVMAALLAAVDADLGACFFGVPADRIESVKQSYGVPPEQASVGVISLGHPGDPAAARSPRQRSRRPRTDLVHRGRWR